MVLTHSLNSDLCYRSIHATANIENLLVNGKLGSQKHWLDLSSSYSSFIPSPVCFKNPSRQGSQTTCEPNSWVWSHSLLGGTPMSTEKNAAQKEAHKTGLFLAEITREISLRNKKGMKQLHLKKKKKQTTVTTVSYLQLILNIWIL